MPAQPEAANLSVGQFAERHRRDMIPLSKTFSYLASNLPLSEGDIREYLEEPIAALPPAIAANLPKVSILLVPYLERIQAKEVITSEKPSESRASWSSCFVSKEEAVLAFAVKDQEIADYHYRFYHVLGAIVAGHGADEALTRYSALLREELNASIHGEVDEESWHLKQTLLRRQSNLRRETKLFLDYARQSFIDTLTLYLHGICCDIDVDTGPRQLPSRFLRKRLVLLQSIYPPPEGYAVFPEEVNR